MVKTIREMLVLFLLMKYYILLFTINLIHMSILQALQKRNENKLEQLY